MAIQRSEYLGSVVHMIFFDNSKDLELKRGVM